MELPFAQSLSGPLCKGPSMHEHVASLVHASIHSFRRAAAEVCQRLLSFAQMCANVLCTVCVCVRVHVYTCVQHYSQSKHLEIQGCDPSRFPSCLRRDDIVPPSMVVCEYRQRRTCTDRGDAEMRKYAQLIHAPVICIGGGLDA